MWDLPRSRSLATALRPDRLATHAVLSESELLMQCDKLASHSCHHSFPIKGESVPLDL